MSPPRRIASISALVLSLAIVYFFTWPVPVDPVAWKAPRDAGLTDPFAPNDLLRAAKYVDLQHHEGPEDIAGGPDGFLYAAMKGGSIVRFDTGGKNLSVFAQPGGRPLGLEFDPSGNLVVANAYLGLQRVAPDGTVETLADRYLDEPIRYADDVAVAKDGMIYFSDASSKFGAREFGGSLEASILDLLEHGAHGRVYRYDPATDSVAIVIDDLQFANGVAIAEDQQSLFVNETTNYRVLRHWIAGPNAGQTEVVIDNLPGFPDNINNGLNGRLWIGLVFPRNKLIDNLSESPWARKMILRLPAPARPQPVATSHVIAINAVGEVLMNLQDASASMPALTGVYETTETLWLTSLLGNRVGRLDKRDLANP